MLLWHMLSGDDKWYGTPWWWHDTLLEVHSWIYWYLVLYMSWLWFIIRDIHLRCWYMVEVHTWYMVAYVWDTPLGDVGTWLRYTIDSTFLAHIMVHGLWVIGMLFEVYGWWYGAWLEAHAWVLCWGTSLLISYGTWCMAWYGIWLRHISWYMI